MAEFVFTDPFFSLGGTDLSDHVRSATLNYSAESKDFTAGGDTTRTRKGGLKDWSMTVEFNQDFASSSVDDTMFSAVGTTATVILRPVNTGGVSTTNPNYTGTGLLTSYQGAVQGSIGDEATTSITIEAAGALSRATS